ncbi:MAG: hypothetical protein ACRC28_04315 [Clostridium sp.]|uniref:hypothetical protein n=1 Tax=Clostridium sp. TaxID=1506 RepID=UPI003F329498
MKYLTLFPLILLLSLSLTGCFNKETPSNEDKPPQVETPVDKKDTDKTEPSTDTTPTEPQTPPPTEDSKPLPPKPTEDKVERTFYLTTLNIDDKVENGGEIKTTGLGVAENLKVILEDVSKKYFDNEEITLTTIETIDNKKIAVVNLSSKSNYWEGRMQGSTGGKITSYTLIENVLQRKYTGYWVDGVKFTLNGKPLQDTGHATNLTKIIYR